MDAPAGPGLSLAVFARRVVFRALLAAILVAFVLLASRRALPGGAPAPLRVSTVVAPDPARTAASAAVSTTVHGPNADDLFLAGLGAADWPVAFESLLATGTDPNQRDELLLVFLGRWADRDLPSALRAWASLRPGPTRSLALANLARRLDPVADQGWARALTDATERGVALGELAIRAAEHLPELAFDLADEAGSAASTGEYLVAVARSVSARAPAEAARILGTRPRTGTTEVLRQYVAVTWARTDPAAAAAYALVNIHGGDEREAALRSILRDWNASEPASLAVWIKRLPATQARNEITQMLGQAAPERPSLSTPITGKT